MVQTILSRLLLSLMILSVNAHAATPGFRARLQNHERTLHFLIAPTDVAGSCSYRILGSSSSRSIHRVPPSAGAVTAVQNISARTSLTAPALPRVRKSRAISRKVSVYFIAEQNCAGSVSYSKSQRVVLSPVSSARPAAQGTRVRTVRSWLSAIGARLHQGKLSLLPAFPNLSFDHPVDFQQPHDGTHRLYVVERAGRIFSFPNSSSTLEKLSFLDIHTKVEGATGEFGLLGLAFHPDFKSNGYFYVYYSRKGDGTSILARYQVLSSNPLLADPNSERILLTVDQPFSNHDGGQIRFGPDGYLYVGLGDGGSGGDPFGNGQNRATLLGKLLRIDVNATSANKNYAIPNDNPFRGNVNGFREEIFAYGLRNPWRFSFDRANGTLWLADVGQDAHEEIDRIIPGGNYGWNKMEGNSCYPADATDCNRSLYQLPIYDYPHSEGQSISGGFVYRGANNPGLVGRYLFADFVVGKIWALHTDAHPVIADLLFDTEHNLSSFGEDENGEVYVLGYDDGKIYTFATS